MEKSSNKLVDFAAKIVQSNATVVAVEIEMISAPIYVNWHESQEHLRGG